MVAVVIGATGTVLLCLALGHLFGWWAVALVVYLLVAAAVAAAW